MLTPEENRALAELLFPANALTRIDAIAKYPKRNVPCVTRFAPSPTGFLHLGGVYMALMCERYAKQHGGVFFLRIEDTDAKREIEGAVGLIVNGLSRFGVEIDEGPVGENFEEVGAYGPYVQSKRVPLYHAFVKELVAQGKAYPCFLAESELEAIREEQNLVKRPTGIYGSHAKWRHADLASVEERLDTGEQYVVRLLAPAIPGTRRVVEDLIRGKIEMEDNYLDIVLLKKDGIPTYHLAHAVDDALMGTTHVIRAEEWLPSLPLHCQLFEAIGMPKPEYLHFAALLKTEGGNKRKLSKRKDPEANIEFFFEQGYEIESLMDYLGNIADSSYEEWKRTNPEKEFRDFEFQEANFPKSGALFDLGKLDSINKERVSEMDRDTFTYKIKAWADHYDHELSGYLAKHPDLSFRAANIERLTDKDPKRFSKLSDVKAQLLPFYPEHFEEAKKTAPAFPENVSTELRNRVLAAYGDHYDPTLGKDDWFEDLKSFGKLHGFAATGEEFKSGGYVGRVGDLAMILRISLLAAKSTPDLCESMKALGREEVKRRLSEWFST